MLSSQITTRPANRCLYKPQKGLFTPPFNLGKYITLPRRLSPASGSHKPRIGKMQEIPAGLKKHLQSAVNSGKLKTNKLERSSVTRQKELEILQEISNYWVSYRKNNQIRENSCILAANFAHSILSRLDIRHEVLPVGTTVFNRRGWELFGVPSHKLPDEAWQVHCSSASPGPGFGGHIIIQTENFFFDPTALQFSRPHHEILLGETLIVPLDKRTFIERGSVPHPIHVLYRTNGFWTFPIGSGLYSYFLEKWNTIYRKSPDWRVPPQALGIPSIIEEMRKGI